MDKQLLVEYVKKSIREKIEKQKRIESEREKSVYLIYKFPGLKQAFTDLMSPAFSRFISNINIIAPKPTTFIVTLVNDLTFYIYYSGKNKYTAKVSGKKYYLNDQNGINKASAAISGLLELNYDEEGVANAKAGSDQTQAADLKASLSGGGSSGGPGDFPGSDTSGPGIDPNAPADAQIPGTEPPAGDGGDTGEDFPLPGDEEPKEEPK